MSIRDMVDSIMTDEEAEEAAAEGAAGDNMGGNDLGGEFGGDIGGEDGGDDLGGLGDLDDGGEDLGGLDDGGFDEMGGEEMGGDGMAGGGGNVDELEHRLDELENEVGSLSSTVNTVRNENEQISESVEEVEENVRKLLDIYEMVTRGVNPFADDVDAGMGMGGEMEDSSFGLFTDEGEEESSESVDEDITEADAEGFFDDDLVEEDDGDDLGGGADEMLDDAGDGDDGGDAGGGTSFEELKDEYESGDADWVEGEDGEEADDDEGDEFEEFGDDLGDDELFDEDLDEAEAGGAVESDDAGLEPETEPDSTAAGGGQAMAEPATEQEKTIEQTPTQTTETTTTAQATETTATTQTTESAADSGKPYVPVLPQGFAADLIVVEWLEFLVSHAGVHETSKALDYYESVGWISEDVASEMESYLRGFQDSGRGSLTIDHHKQSLEYINQLNGTVSVQPATNGIGPR